MQYNTRIKQIKNVIFDQVTHQQRVFKIFQNTEVYAVAFELYIEGIYVLLMDKASLYSTFSQSKTSVL